MNDIEKDILSKIEKIEEKRSKERVLNYNGNIEKKTVKTEIEITNISDFKPDVHNIIYDVIKRTLMRSIQIDIKECVFYNENNLITLEGVMDATDDSYYINNIMFRIQNIKIVRVILKEKETLFYIPDNDKIKSFLYDTKDEYIADIKEAKEKNMMILEEKTVEKMVYKDKKLRYSYELDKIYL